MQTDFSEDQLKDKDNKSSEKILRKCVHCGMCNATCPTFNLLGDELDGPRGRIYLIKEMIEKKKTPTKKVVSHIDKCLSCYACMTTCPSGVNYMHLIDHGRSHIEKTYKRPFSDRLMRNFLSQVMPYPLRFRIIGILTSIIKPFSFMLPEKIKSMISLMPISFPRKNLPKKEIYFAQGEKKPIARVALLAGCVQQVIAPQINPEKANKVIFFKYQKKSIFSMPIATTPAADPIISMLPPVPAEKAIKCQRG